MINNFEELKQDPLITPYNYQQLIKDKYKSIILPQNFNSKICHKEIFSLLSENVQTSMKITENLIENSSHWLILRRIFIEDEEYPDFLLNLLEIQLMKDLYEQHQNLIKMNSEEMFNEKFSLQILGYRYSHLENNNSNPCVLEVLYISHVNSEKLLCFTQNLQEKIANSNNLPIKEEKLCKIIEQILQMKQNYFESMDSFYCCLQAFRENQPKNLHFFLNSSIPLQEKTLRTCYMKPLHLLSEIIKSKLLENKEKIWALCSLGKRYHQLKKNQQSLKIFQETYYLRMREWGTCENTDTADSLNRVGCVLLRDKDARNLKELFEKVYEIKKNFLGEIHNNVAVSLYNLGIAYVQYFDFNEAVIYFTQTIKTYLKLNKGFEIKLADCYQALGTVYMKLKKFDESLRFLKEALLLNKNISQEKQMLLKCGNIFYIMAMVYDQKKEPVYCYINMLKAFKIFNLVKAERNEVIGYMTKCKKYREENKRFILIDIAFVLKKKLRALFKRNIIIEDILKLFNKS